MFAKGIPKTSLSFCDLFWAAHYHRKPETTIRIGYPLQDFLPVHVCEGHVSAKLVSQVAFSYTQWNDSPGDFFQPMKACTGRRTGANQNRSGIHADKDVGRRREGLSTHVLRSRLNVRRRLGGSLFGRTASPRYIRSS